MTKEDRPHAPKARKQRSRNAPPAPSRRERLRTSRVSDVIYDDLRSAIIRMDLRPGDPVVEAHIRDRHGVSRTPVREAVLRLAEEGLVDVVSKSGTFVSRIPLVALREAIVARRALEAVTCAAAAERASESDVMSLRAIVQRQRERAETGDLEFFHDADDAFHAEVAAIAQYPGLWTMISNIRVQVERYRRLTLPQPGRMKMVVQEHAAVVDAIAAHDAETAVKAMHVHLDKLQLDISIFRDLWPECFIIDFPIDNLAAE
ncbi:GntR family transcriptional regulator [Algicella marina]|uniref:FCD domain-containing protein n=1 Tax=Algicella marina TaxID=2683284 RepID=A0A6P1T243_9RHOB|nr:GntR family transcriptional regulator [Algicella marina]QHQ35369.1 FCD domain-containing protein [Algicella marina]